MLTLSVHTHAGKQPDRLVHSAAGLGWQHELGLHHATKEMSYVRVRQGCIISLVARASAGSTKFGCNSQ